MGGKYRKATLLGVALSTVCMIAACSNSLQPEMAQDRDLTPLLSWHAGGEEPLNITTDRSEYNKGENITVSITNSSEFTLGMGPCLDLERKENNWNPVYEKLPCALVSLTAKPGESLTWKGPETQNLASGDYRLIVRDVLPHVQNWETEEIFIIDSIGTVSVSRLKSMQVTSNAFRIR